MIFLHYAESLARFSDDSHITSLFEIYLNRSQIIHSQVNNALNSHNVIVDG